MENEKDISIEICEELYAIIKKYETKTSTGHVLSRLLWFLSIMIYQSAKTKEDAHTLLETTKKSAYEIARELDE